MASNQRVTSGERRLALDLGEAVGEAGEAAPVVAAAQGQGADAGVERQRGGEVAVGFGQALGDAHVAALQLAVGEPRLALEAELVEAVPGGLIREHRVRFGSHIDILARIPSFGYLARRLYYGFG